MSPSRLHPEAVARAVERRARAWRLWRDAGRGLTPPPPRAFAAFGAGTMIIPPARVEAPGCIHLGDRVLVHEHAWLCVKPQPGLPRPRLVIGSGTSVNRFAKIVCAGEVVIGEDCLTGDQVYIADTHYPPGPGPEPIGRRQLAEPRPVRIGRGSFIGVRAVIEPGVTLGEHVYVGAGAVVREDVDDFTVVVGSPARPVRRYDRDRDEWVDVD